MSQVHSGNKCLQLLFQNMFVFLCLKKNVCTVGVWCGYRSFSVTLHLSWDKACNWTRGSPLSQTRLWLASSWDSLVFCSFSHTWLFNGGVGSCVGSTCYWLSRFSSSAFSFSITMCFFFSVFVYALELVKVRAVVFLLLPHTSRFTSRTVLFLSFCMCECKLACCHGALCVKIRGQLLLSALRLGLYFYHIKTSLIISMCGLDELPSFCWYLVAPPISE